MINVLVSNGQLYSYNESNNFWADLGFINNIYKDIDLQVIGGIRCSRGFYYFFKGSILSEIKLIF